MKRIILIMMAFIALNANAIAQEDSGGKSETMSESDKILLEILKSDEPTAFSLFQPTVYATLYNKVVNVDLSELPESATVTITRLATGEEVYSQTGTGNILIDLSTCGKGQYRIDIVSSGLWLQGEFILQ